VSLTAWQGALSCDPYAVFLHTFVRFQAHGMALGGVLYYSAVL
jgi:hypothetical protein